jgi:flagellar hook assembly protein FlgD
VKRLTDMTMSEGEYEVIWDGTGSHGSRVGAGMYLIRMQAESYVMTKKVLLVQ